MTGRARPPPIMKLRCPRCSGPIAAAEVNVQADLARCEACDEVFRASELLDAGEPGVVDLRPPAGSTIVFDAGAGGLARFEIPRVGFKGSNVGGVAFATFWMGFIAFWTFGAAAGGGGFFAFFSIPFWLAGLAMWSSILTGIFEHQTLEVAADGLVIRKHRPLRSRVHLVSLAEIDSIGMGETTPSGFADAARQIGARHGGPSRQSTSLPVPVIARGTETLTFAENVSEAEMRWLTGVLRSIVSRLRGSPVRSEP